MASTTAIPDDLTERQRDVLRLHTEGKNPTDIGRELNISSQAVHGHMKRLRGKGLIAEENPKPTTSSPRRERGEPTTIDPHAAIMAAMESIQQQVAQLESRLEAIAQERVGLNDEEASIRQALNTLAAMQHAPSAPAADAASA